MIFLIGLVPMLATVGLAAVAWQLCSQNWSGLSHRILSRHVALGFFWIYNEPIAAIATKAIATETTIYLLYNIYSFLDLLCENCPLCSTNSTEVRVAVSSSSFGQSLLEAAANLDEVAASR